MAQPPSFYERPGQTSRLPAPIDSGAPIAEGVDAVARAVSAGQASEAETDQRVRESNLQADRIARERALQLQTGDTAAYLADEAGNLQADLIGLRQKAAPGAAGYEDQVDARITKFRDDAAERVGTDPELRARFVDNIATIAANARVGELTWAATQRAKKSGDDFDALDNGLHNNIRTAVTAGTFNPQMVVDAAALRKTAIDALPVDGTTKNKLNRDGHWGDLISATEGYIDSNPHAALDWIDAGRIDELPEASRDELRTRARVAADRADNQAEQAANAAVAVQRAQAGNLIEDVNSAVHVDEGALQGAYVRATASDKPEDIRQAHDLKIALAKNAVTAKYDNSTQDERRSAISEIEGHKGWEENAQLTAAHAQLQTLIGRDDHAADQDPLSLYQRQTGQQLAPLNLGDPAAMRQRFIAADQAAERYKKQVPMAFTEPEASNLRQQYNQANVDGKAAFIETLGAYGSDRARQMMFQIAPTKPELGRLAELSASRDPALRSLVREASDGSAVPVKDGVAAAVRGTMQRDFGAAMSRMPGDRQRAIAQVATWIYAHRAAASGKADTLDPALASQSVDAALGGANGRGGLGRRNGSAVVLPMGSTQDDFDRLLAIGAAHPGVVRQAANGVPTWNGRPLHQREFLDLVPVLVHDDGVIAAYAFRSRGGSGYVKNDRGQDYLLDTRGLAKSLVAQPSQAAR